MKLKKLLVLVCTCFFLAGCNSKEDEERIAELQKSNASLVEENASLQAKIEELIDAVKKLEGENAGLQQEIKVLSTAKDDLINSEKYEIHDLHCTLNFELNGYNTKIYKDPKLEELCYTVQKGDIVEVLSFIYSYEISKNFIKVKVNNGQEGYIRMGGNPYNNGNFEKIDTLEVDGVETVILKFEKSFAVSEGVNIKEFPSETANNLHEITHTEGSNYYKSFAITSDYKWVKMQILDFTGWVPAESLSVDRGGPILNTPEQYVLFALIGSNEI